MVSVNVNVYAWPTLKSHYIIHLALKIGNMPEASNKTEDLGILKSYEMVS